jgi:CheY-like chemotaxis protein
VLVADDSHINRIVAARALERCGCRADVVDDGRAALKALETQHYDAVLMDSQMPNLDGYQATNELRRREHGARHTPVIAMTAHALDSDRERCLQAGMDDYISKPMRRTDLAATLQRWIPNHTHARTQPRTGPPFPAPNPPEEAAAEGDHPPPPPRHTGDAVRTS